MATRGRGRAGAAIIVLSQDSRELGPASSDSIVGKARLRYWPLSRFGSPA